jgi:hypothetical protein
MLKGRNRAADVPGIADAPPGITRRAGLPSLMGSCKMPPQVFEHFAAALIQIP